MASFAARERESAPDGWTMQWHRYVPLRDCRVHPAAALSAPGGRPANQPLALTPGNGRHWMAAIYLSTRVTAKTIGDNTHCGRQGGVVRQGPNIAGWGSVQV